ncbi:MAG: hypothetical protein IIZ43_00900 [Eubacterium sp.]|nr:hypothetical protein [Eubacterium sp.]
MKRRTFCTIIILMICVLMMAAAGCGEQGRTDIAASTEISVPVETVETPDPEETEAEEPDDSAQIMQHIYDYLLQDGSAYMQYKDVHEDAGLLEELDGDTLTITASGDIEGVREFKVSDSYLIFTVPEEDYSASTFFDLVSDAACDYLGMDPLLFRGYIRGMDLLGQENQYYSLTEEEGTQDMQYRLYVGGPYEMTELDQMALAYDLNRFDPFVADAMAYSTEVGRICMFAKGTNKSADILIGESEVLDEYALQAMKDAAAALKPAGYQSFGTGYTKLEEKKTGKYRVTFLSGRKAKKLLTDAGEQACYSPNYEYVLIHFGK